MHIDYVRRATVRALMGALCAALLFASMPAAANATEWFVDGTAAGRDGAGTRQSPFQDGWQAAKVARPGDTIRVLNTTTYRRLSVLASGTAARPITVTGVGGGASRTRIQGDGSDSALWINADYVVVNNFDVSSPEQHPGISVAPSRHHISITNNVVHDSGGSGINTIGNDYMRISHNVVYGNAHITKDSRQGSGISLLAALDVDDYTGLKNIVDGNIVYANTNVPYCFDPYCWAHRLTSDGNGIIVDDFHRRRFDGVHYRGQTLIANNVVFGNGGRGIYLYRADNVLVYANTVFSNNQDPYEGNWHPGEIGLAVVGGTRIANNILYHDGKAGPNRTGSTANTHVSFSAEYLYDDTGPVVFGHNLLFNALGDAARQSFGRDNVGLSILGDNVFADPKLVNPSLDPALADFRPLPGSVALDAGDPAHTVTYDALWTRRTGNTSLGAYERAAAP